MFLGKSGRICVTREELELVAFVRGILLPYKPVSEKNLQFFMPLGVFSYDWR